MGRFGPDSDLKRWGVHLARRGGKSGKKRAIVAVARKLAVLLHRLWVTGDPIGLYRWQPSTAQVRHNSVTAPPTRSINPCERLQHFNFELTEQRVPGDCVFFPRLLEPSERLQRRTDTEDPKVHPKLQSWSKCGWKRANQDSALFGAVTTRNCKFSVVSHFFSFL